MPATANPGCRQGEDFAMMAQNYSEDPTTTPNGGDLGIPAANRRSTRQSRTQEDGAVPAAGPDVTYHPHARTGYQHPEDDFEGAGRPTGSERSAGAAVHSGASSA